MYFLGIAIFVFGLAFLLRNLGFLDFEANFWSVFYPLIIVAIGAGIILATYEGRKFLRKLKNILKGDFK